MAGDSQAKPSTKNRFGSFAVRMGFVAEEELAQCVEEQRRSVREGETPKRLGEILIEKGYMTRGQIREVLLAQQKVTGDHRLVGGFEVLSKIGVGGMGSVYKARQVSLDRMVALKVLPPKFAEDKDFIDRFVREARAAAALNHPNIIQGIDVGFADGYNYFAMELVEGRSLSQIIKQDGPLGEVDALRVAEEMSGALQHANSRGLVHRDIKPGNILIGSDGVSKLADLGLARREIDDPSISHVGKAVGTPYYISPEQAKGEAEIDIRADIYSLGATLFHAVTGQPAYDGPSPTVVMTKHLTDPVPSAREVRPEISASFDKLIRKMMAKERDGRYQTPDDLVEDVRRIQSGKGVKIRPGELRKDAATRPLRARTTPSSRSAPAGVSGSSVPYIAGGVAAAVLLVVAAIVVFGGSKPPATPIDPPEVSKRPGVVTTPEDPRPGSPLQADNLREMFTYATGFAKDNPGRYGDVIAHFEAVRKAGKGTKYSLMASEAIEGIKRARDEKADAVFNQRKAAAEKLLARGQFRAAIDAIGDAPPSLGGTDLGRRLAELKSGYGAEFTRAFTDAKRRAEELIKKDRFDEAPPLFSQFTACGVKDIQDSVRAEIARIAAAKKAHEESAASASAAAAKKQLDAVLDEFWARLSKRDYVLARNRIRSLMQDQAKVAILGELKRCAAHLGRIENVWAAAEQGLKDAEGRSVSLHVSGIRRSGRIMWVRDGKIGLGLSVGRRAIETQLQFLKLSTKDVVTHSGYETDDAEKRLSLGVFMLAEGKAAEARKHFAVAKRLGADTAPYDERMAIMERGKAEVSAEKALVELRDLIGSKKWEGAQKALGELKEHHGSTRTVKSASDELAKAVDAIDDGLLAAGRVVLFKDFSLPDVYFMDSESGSDVNDGRKWSTAWKSFDSLWRHRLPPVDGRKTRIFFRGRGARLPYHSSGMNVSAGKPPHSFIPWRGKMCDLSLVGVDDTGEVVFSPNPVIKQGTNFTLVSGLTRTECVNIRFDGFWNGMGSAIAGNRWTGCRFIFTTDPGRFGWGTIQLSSYHTDTPDKAGEAVVVRDCLFVRGGGVGVSAFANGLVEHCTFVDCRPKAFGEYWHSGKITLDLHNIMIRDCLIANGPRAFNFHARCTPTAVENCFVANIPNVGEPRVADKVTKIPDPGFRNPGNLDYSLGPRSPLRGKATDGTDVGFRPRECLKAAMELIGKMQVEYKRQSRQKGAR